MSFIASFALCAKEDYEHLLHAAGAEKESTKVLIQEISQELETHALPQGEYSGEVYMSLFTYLEMEQGMELHAYEGEGGLGEQWREVTGDEDVILWNDSLKKECLTALDLDALDPNALNEYVSELFGTDFDGACVEAAERVLEYLKQAAESKVLVYRLF